MGEQLVVGRRQGGAQIALQTGCVAAFVMANPGAAARFVQGRPARHAVAQALHHQPRVVGKGGRGVAALPAAGIGQRERQVPVIERDGRSDAARQQAVDQALVEVQAGGVEPAAALGQHARPGDREAVALQIQLLHQVQVLRPAAVVIAGDVAMAAVADATCFVRKAVPPAGPPTVDGDAALDLVGRGRGAEQKAGRERVAGRPGGRWFCH